MQWLQLQELKPDKFTPKVITKTADYVYVEYESPTFGFIDDVEFYFPDVSALPLLTILANAAPALPSACPVTILCVFKADPAEYECVPQ